VIDIDYDDVSVDLVIIGEIVSKSNKGNPEASKLLHGSKPPFASNFRSVKKRQVAVAVHTTQISKMKF
jgi:hypothetical protein